MSYGFVPALDELLTEAWERCGKSSSVLNGEVVRSARRSLQLMLVDWTTRGANLWQIEALPVQLVAGTAAYTLPPETIDVLQATVAVLQGSMSQDLVLTAISRDEYVAMPNKTLAGRPTQYWVQRVLPAPVLVLFPTPDQPYVLTAQRLRQPQDVLGFGGTADVPLIWSEALTAGWAARLAMKFAPERAAMLDAEAREKFVSARGEDRERVPYRVTPRLRF